MKVAKECMKVNSLTQSPHSFLTLLHNKMGTILQRSKSSYCCEPQKGTGLMGFYTEYGVTSWGPSMCF